MSPTGNNFFVSHQRSKSLVLHFTYKFAFSCLFNKTYCLVKANYKKNSLWDKILLIFVSFSITNLSFIACPKFTRTYACHKFSFIVNHVLQCTCGNYVFNVQYPQ